MDLKNKTVLFLGSSVTYGDNGVSFAELMAETCGIISVKEAVSGTTLADIGPDSYVSRLKKADKTLRPHIFICQLSTNDATLGLDPSKTEESIRFIVSYVREVYNCPIGFYTGTKFDSAPYAGLVELILRLSSELDFSVLDLWNDEEMCAVSPEDYARYMHDAVHPSVLGYREWWLPKFIEFCEKI